MKFDKDRADKLIARLTAEICDKLNITSEELDSMDLKDVEKIIEEKCCGRMRLRTNRGYLS